MSLPHRIEGYAIVSEDGMIAAADGLMPDSLRIEADQRFFEHGLDGVDAVAHGRHSHEQQPRSHLRRRLIVTRTVAGLAPDPSNPQGLFWNPQGASFEDAWAALGLPDGTLAVIGGPEVFGMFLPRYDVFYLSRVAHLRLPGGRPVFPAVPACTPEDALCKHGLEPSRPRTLDAGKGVTVVTWSRRGAANGARAVNES
jgi:dihydrofolate reductase